MLRASSLSPRRRAVSGLTRRADPRQIALDVGEKDRHTGGGQLLGDDLQCLRLPCAGRAGDQAVTVHHRERQPNPGVRMRLVVDDQRAELHSRPIECVCLLDLAEEIVAHASNICAALPVGHGVRWSRWGPVLVRRAGYECDASGVL